MPNGLMNALCSLFLICYPRSVQGKLCFGYEECNQFPEAEKAGAIALDHTPNDIWAIHSVAHIREETYW